MYGTSQNDLTPQIKKAIRVHALSKDFYSKLTPFKTSVSILNIYNKLTGYSSVIVILTSYIHFDCEISLFRTPFNTYSTDCCQVVPI